MNKRLFHMTLLFSTVILFCCRINSKANNELLVKHTESSGVSVHCVGELSFRRTFAGVQFIKDSIKQDRYIEQQEKSNPTLDNITHSNETLRKRLEELGLVKGMELLPTRFSAQAQKLNSSDTLAIRFNRLGILEHKLTIFKGKDSAVMQVEPANGITHSWIDVMPGGLKELVIFGEFYIMNGYNYSLTVYEIRN